MIKMSQESPKEFSEVAIELLKKIKEATGLDMTPHTYEGEKDSE